MARSDLIDQYVMEVRRQLSWRRDVDDIADELDDHLRSASESLVEQGTEPTAAQREVLGRFGEPGQVSMSFVSTGSRGLAVPSEFTRSAGVIGMASAAGWCALALAWNGSYLAERATGDWEGLPWSLFIIATAVLLAATTTQVLLVVGLDRRHGGLGPLGVGAVALTGLGAVASLVSWFVPGWAALLGLGSLLLAFPLFRRGIAPKAATVIGALAWPLALGTFAGLRALEIGPVDAYGDHPLAINIGLTLGAGLSAVSFALLGRWMAREIPATVPVEARTA